MIRIANVCVPGPGSDTVARLGFLLERAIYELGRHKYARQKGLLI